MVSVGHLPMPLVTRLDPAIDLHGAHAITDAHAKNTPVFRDRSGGLRLTPMYDLAPTLAFINQRHFGMSVAGKFMITEITRDHPLREAPVGGVPKRLARGGGRAR